MRLKLEASTRHRPITGLLVPDHPGERVANPRDPASAQPGPEGRAARAIRLMDAHDKPHAWGQAAGALKSSRIGTKSRIGAKSLLSLGQLIFCYLAR